MKANIVQCYNTLQWTGPELLFYSCNKLGHNGVLDSRPNETMVVTYPDSKRRIPCSC